MRKKINLALQILPFAGAEPDYALIDKAIKFIKNSGVKYNVGAFETVMEGFYDELLEIVQKTQEICYENGAQSMLVYIKIQSSKNKDISIEEKTEKYK